MNASGAHCRVESVWNDNQSYVYMKPARLSESTPRWGPKRFYYQESIRFRSEEKYLNLDVKSETEGEMPGSLDSITSDVGITSFLWHNYKKNEHTDVEFSVEDKINGSVATFSAHKIVLSLWSPYFADMFYGPDINTDNIILVKDVDKNAFEDMLRFMYGCMPPLKSVKETFEIYKVSSKFYVSSLMIKSHRAISRIEPTVSNVFEIWEAANYIDTRYCSMQKRCRKLIQEKTSEVLQFSDVKNITSPMIHLLLDSSTLSLSSEYDLLKWIYTWAKNQYIKISFYSSVREVMEEFLPKIHFTSLSSKEFAEFYMKHENFCEKDDAFSILMNIALPKSCRLPEWQDSEATFRVYNK